MIRRTAVVSRRLFRRITTPRNAQRAARASAGMARSVGLAVGAVALQHIMDRHEIITPDDVFQAAKSCAEVGMLEFVLWAVRVAVY